MSVLELETLKFVRSKSGQGIYPNTTGLPTSCIQLLVSLPRVNLLDYKKLRALLAGNSQLMGVSKRVADTNWAKDRTRSCSID